MSLCDIHADQNNANDVNILKEPVLKVPELQKRGISKSQRWSKNSLFF